MLADAYQMDNDEELYMVMWHRKAFIYPGNIFCTAIPMQKMG